MSHHWVTKYWFCVMEAQCFQKPEKTAAKLTPYICNKHKLSPDHASPKRAIKSVAETHFIFRPGPSSAAVLLSHSCTCHGPHWSSPLDWPPSLTLYLSRNYGAAQQLPDHTLRRPDPGPGLWADLLALPHHGEFVGWSGLMVEPSYYLWVSPAHPGWLPWGWTLAVLPHRASGPLPLRQQLALAAPRQRAQSR